VAALIRQRHPANHELVYLESSHAHPTDHKATHRDGADR
jgi:hypothetical protein